MARFDTRLSGLAASDVTGSFGTAPSYGYVPCVDPRNQGPLAPGESYCPAPGLTLADFANATAPVDPGNDLSNLPLSDRGSLEANTAALAAAGQYGVTSSSWITLAVVAVGLVIFASENMPGGRR